MVDEVVGVVGVVVGDVGWDTPNCFDALVGVTKPCTRHDSVKKNDNKKHFEMGDTSDCMVGCLDVIRCLVVNSKIKVWWLMLVVVGWGVV